MEQRLSLVTLGVADLARSRAFYEALGWKTGAEPGDDVVFFQAGGAVVALWDRAPPGRGLRDRRPGRLGRHHARAQRPLPGRGGRGDRGGSRARARPIAREPGPTFWGGYSGVFHDPDGHPWEVAHNPHWTLGPDGSVELG